MNEMPPLIYEVDPNVTPITKVGMRYSQMSEKATEWPKEILDHLYAEYPALGDQPNVKISFEQRDEKKGYAVGKVAVANKISIPVFIKKGKLAPLDTFVFKKKAYRLTSKRIKDVLFNPNMFSGPASPDDIKDISGDTSLYNATRPNEAGEGRNVFGSIVEEMLPTISDSDIEKFAAELKESPEVARNFVINGHADLIDRILQAESPSPEETMKVAQARMPVNVIQVRKSDGDNFQIKFAGDFAYDPQEIIVPNEKIGAVLRSVGIRDMEGVLRKTARGEAFTWAHREHSPDPLYISKHGHTSQLESYGTYAVIDEKGKEHVGKIYPNVFDFDKNATHRMMFVSPDIRVMQEKIAGVPVEADFEVSSDEPNPKDIGSFVFDIGNAGIATVPIQVEYVEKTAGEVSIGAQTFLGKPVLFKLSKMATDIVPLATSPGLDDRDQFLLPANAMFVKMSNDTTLVADAGVLTKMAVDTISGETITVRGFNGTYVLHGALIEELGDDYVELREDDALFKLACLGLSIKEARDVLTEANVGHEDVTISGLNKLVPLQKKIAHIRDETILPILAQIPFLKQATVKIASKIKDPETVDRVLSLNFLNPQNIEVLVDHMKDLEKTGSRLSELLIAARYGADTDLDEDSIVSARKSIDDVREGLTQLKSRVGRQAEAD